MADKYTRKTSINIVKSGTKRQEGFAILNQEVDQSYTRDNELAADIASKLSLAGGDMTGAINEAQGTDIASAATTDIGAAAGNFVRVTGTTTIAGLGTVKAGTRRIVEFTGTLTLTHDANKLILPGAANITTAAGDTAQFTSLGAGNWKCVGYTRANGTYVNFDMAGGLVDRLNTVLEILTAYPSVSGGAITITAAYLRLINHLTGAYAYIAAGTYTLTAGGALVVNWDLKTTYGTAAALTPTVVNISSLTTRPHFNLIPIAWYDGANVYYKSGWAHPPYGSS